MSEPAATNYDEVPYDSRPRYATHPDCLATLATILGLKPAPPDRCRYLELGCSTGGNLLPLAESMPHSAFVGIDHSAVQIDTGRRVAAALGLDNLRMEARSILDLDGSIGPFDYIVAHGVYSWVPAEVRDRLLWVCKRLLAPHGVAYVSYNTLPGWHLRAPVRELMSFHVRDIEGPLDRARQARALLEFLADVAPNPESTWAKLLRDEADHVRPEGDYYVAHEHLEPDNHPVYFHQFMAHAAAHGLKYLGEASDRTNLDSFPEDVQSVLRRISPDLVHAEQYIDFLKGRTFRRTLLVHDDAPINRAPQPEVAAGLWVSGAARPTSERPVASSSKVEEFQNEDGVCIETNVPITKAALVELFEAWPRSFAFEELLAAARARVGEGGSMSEAQARDFLARSLVQLYVSNLVGLHVHVPPYVIEVSEKPRATPLTRLQARTGAVITNRRHRQVTLSVFDRAVLARLDGGRGRADLVGSLAAGVAGGELGLRKDEQPLTDESAVRATLEQELGPALQRLAHSAVLVG